MIPLLPKSWVQLPLFDGLDRGEDAPRGVVVSIDPSREADAIVRLVLSMKPPKGPPPANAPDIGAAPDPRIFVRGGVELQVFGGKRKHKRLDSGTDKAVAAEAVTSSESKNPK